MPLRPGARAWAVWTVGLAAYVIGVLNRTSLGVAGLDAQHRFGIGAGALASFAVLQILVYAGLQVLSAVPLAALLAGPGWPTAFLSAAAAGVVSAIVAMVALRDTPERRIRSGPAITFARVGGELAAAWRHPGTRLGIWSHFTTQFTGTVFALIWGFPFLIAGEGLPRSTASALLTVYVLVGMAAGPLIGVMVQRHPMRRSWVVLGVVVANAAGWGLVIAWPGRAPLPVLVALVLALGLGGPGSMVGFDLARTFNPPSRLGTASGMVNVGGFFASLITILLVGMILDIRTGGRADYDIGDFKVAMSVQFLIMAIGIAGILRTRRLARRRLAEQGVVVRPVREVLAEKRWFSNETAGKASSFDREPQLTDQRRT